MNIKKITVVFSSCVTLFFGLQSYGMSDLELAYLEKQVEREINETQRLLEWARARQERKNMLREIFCADMVNIRYGAISPKDVQRWLKEAKDWVQNGVRARMLNSGDGDIAEIMCRNAISRIDAWYYKSTGQFFEFSSRPDDKGPEQNAWDVCQFVHWAYTK